MEKDNDVHDFLKDMEAQMSSNYKRKKWKIFGLTFITLNVVLFLLMFGLFKEPMNRSIEHNAFNFYGIFCVLIFILGLMSFFQANSMIKYSLISSVKFDSKWENINLYQFLLYFLSKNNNSLSDEELESLVSQHFEKYRLKENLELTVLTSDVAKKKELDLKKNVLNGEYQAKERKYSLNNLLWEYV